MYSCGEKIYITSKAIILIVIIIMTIINKKRHVYPSKLFINKVIGYILRNATSTLKFR